MAYYEFRYENCFLMNNLLPSLAAPVLREQSEAVFTGYLFLMRVYRVLKQRKLTVLIKAGNIGLLIEGLIYQEHLNLQ